MTRVLLTGATGFVGGRVARRLRERGDEVVAAVRTPAARLDDLGVEQRPIGLEGIDASLVDGMDAIVHTAASAGPDLTSARAVNVRGAAGIVTAAREAGGSRLVHVSTTSVYDLAAIGDTEVHEDAPLVSEGAEPSPASSSGSVYAVTKAEAEREVAAFAASGGSVAILRPPAVLGAGPTSTWGTRVPRRLLDGDGWPRHPGTTYAWVHVDDLVDAIVAAMDGTANATVNVVGGHTTVAAYLDAVADLLPGEVRVETGGGEPWRGSYATDALPATFGVRPSRSFPAAMAEIADSWADGPPDA